MFVGEIPIFSSRGPLLLAGVPSPVQKFLATFHRRIIEPLLGTNMPGNELRLRATASAWNWNRNRTFQGIQSHRDTTSAVSRVCLICFPIVFLQLIVFLAKWESDNGVCHENPCSILGSISHKSLWWRTIQSDRYVEQHGKSRPANRYWSFSFHILLI